MSEEVLPYSMTNEGRLAVRMFEQVFRTCLGDTAWSRPVTPITTATLKERAHAHQEKH